MNAVDRKYLLDKIKDLIIEHGKTVRWGLYIIIIAIWANTCEIVRDQHSIKKQLDKIETQLQKEKIK